MRRSIPAFRFSKGYRKGFGRGGARSGRWI